MKYIWIMSYFIGLMVGHYMVPNSLGIILSTITFGMVVYIEEIYKAYKKRIRGTK